MLKVGNICANATDNFSIMPWNYNTNRNNRQQSFLNKTIESTYLWRGAGLAMNKQTENKRNFSPYLDNNLLKNRFLFLIFTKENL